MGTFAKLARVHTSQTSPTMTQLNVHGVDITEVTDFPHDPDVLKWIPFDEITQSDIIAANRNHTSVCALAGDDDDDPGSPGDAIPVDAFVAYELLERYIDQQLVAVKSARLDSRAVGRSARAFGARASELGSLAWAEFAALKGPLEDSIAQQAASELAALALGREPDSVGEAFAVIERHRASNPIKPGELAKKRRVKKTPKHRLGKPVKFTRPATRTSARRRGRGPVVADLD